MKESNAKYCWTKPYFGVSHYGEFGSKRWWATLTFLRDDCWIVDFWFPGCQFSPLKEIFVDETIARQTAETWVSLNTRSLLNA